MDTATPIRQSKSLILAAGLCCFALVSIQARDVKPVERPKPVDGDQVSSRLAEASDFIRAVTARSTFNVDGSGLAAAVLDTGLRTTHIDFNGRIPTQRNFTTDNAGNINDATDGNGHGTNVSGIVVANGNHIGIAPGANVVPLKVLSNSGAGSFSNILNALNWIKDNHQIYNITVANLSLGDGNNYKSLNADSVRNVIQQLRQLKIAVVVSAGNSFYDEDSQQGMGYPAIFPETVSVGAVYDQDRGSFSYGGGATAFSTGPGRLTPFSQRLHESVHAENKTDIFAPGAPIKSSGIASDTASSEQHGTSQASPVVAGMILLLQQHYKRATGELPSVDDLETWMRSGGMIINDGDDEDDNATNTGMDYLRLDALGALQATGIAPGEEIPDEPVAPTIVSHPTDMTVSLGSTATFMVEAQGDDLSYQWKQNGVVIINATEASYSFMVDSAGFNGLTFSCVVSNSVGSVESDAGTLTVQDDAPTQLTSGLGQPDNVEFLTFNHYYIVVPDGMEMLEIKTTNATDDVDLYVRKGELPDAETYDFRPYTGSGNETVTITSSSAPTLSAGVWYCSVRGYAAGSFTITATVVEPAPNHAPQISSGPSYNPNPARADDQLAFTVAASDSDGDLLSYAWDFGDGTSAASPAPQHSYAQEGTYQVTLVVSDGTDQATATFSVEILPAALPLNIDQLQLKLNFKKSGRDSITIKGSLDLNPEAQWADDDVRINVGGAVANFTLDGRGKARTQRGKVRIKSRQDAVFQVRLKRGDWADQWADEGLTDSDARDQNVTLTVTIVIGNTTYQGEKQLAYRAKQGRWGKAR